MADGARTPRRIRVSRELGGVAVRLSLTLSNYFGRRFLAGVTLILCVLVGLVVVVDFVELSRRAANRESAPLSVIIELAVLRIPFMAQKILPFAVLFGGMLTFARLTRSHELVVTRAAGVSVWQFLTPPLVVATFLGIFVMTVFNPLSSALVYRFEQIEAKHIRGKPSLLAVSPSGLWLREGSADEQVVIHALGVSHQGLELRDVIIFIYEGDDRFARRIDADTASLAAGRWRLDNALVSQPDVPTKHFAEYFLDTELTIDSIRESFAAPESVSFWALPGFIEALEEAGFSAVRHRLHWNAILSSPLLLCAMVLIAATFSLRLVRQGKAGLVVVGGLVTGFLLYFLTDVVFALGLSGGIPVVMAAWTPATVSTLLGLAMILHLEDG